MVTRSLEGALLGIGELQAHLPHTTAALLGIAALGAATLPGLSLLTQYVNTMAHEGAHAVMGSATGRKVTAVSLRGNGEGRTTLGRPQGAGFVLAGIVGYLGPSVFGLGAAKLIQIGHIIAVLWLALLALVCLAIMVRRNGFGLVAVIVTGVGVYLVARYAPLGGQVAAAYGIAWFLLLSGVRVVLLHGRDAGDAIVLRELTRLPRGLWAGIWLIGSAAALIVGGGMLV
jgi:hypothetical protein